MVTSTDIVNAAISQMGDNQPPVTGVAPNFDNSTAGKAAKSLYTRCVQTVARQFGWDFSRNTAALVPTGNPAPFPWADEYLYPTNGIQVRQIMPPSLVDPNDPLPLNWSVANVLVNGVPKKVVQCNQANALAVFTNQPPEDLWDPGFVEAVVRLLASEFAVALAGKPDTAQFLLESGAKFTSIAETRDS